MHVQDALHLLQSSTQNTNTSDRFLFVRIMGEVVSNSSKDSEVAARESLKWRFLIDDGTGVIMVEKYNHHKKLQFVSDIPVPDQIDFQKDCPTEGQTVDCVGCLDILPHLQNPFNESLTKTLKEEIHHTGARTNLPSSNRLPVIYLHHRAIVTDPNASSFRALEIIHTKKRFQDSKFLESGETNGSKMNEFSCQIELGPLSAVMGTFYKNEKGELCMNKSHILQLIKATIMDGGVGIDDLAVVLDCCSHIDLLRSVLQELQCDGEIYQSASGDYLPL